MTSLVASLKQAREWATPTLKSSAFLSRGVLTPEEFVKAGDELVYKCPTWSWERGDVNKVKSYLPPDKQYLVTRNVPCQTRVSELENSISLTGDTAHVDDECGGDDWLVSHVVTNADRRKIKQNEREDNVTNNNNDDDEELDDDFDILDEDGEVVQKENKASAVVKMANLSVGDNDKDMDKSADKVDDEEDDDDDDDEYADMADFDDDNIMEDEAAAVTDSAGATTTTRAASADEDDDNIMKVRTYDLSITYDKYYQTPRVWMMGYAESNPSQPLTGEEMLQDVMSDYANRTVTIEVHPHVAGPHASIHPCQHGAVMKNIVRNLTRAAKEGGEGGGGGGGAGPSVEMYLFIFLKFVSSIIPTINYDFTMDVTASTRK